MTITDVVRPDHPVTTGLSDAAATKHPRLRRRLVLTILAALTMVAAVLGAGPDGLIPFGLLLAFSISSEENEAATSVRLTPRNLVIAAAIGAAFGWFWLLRVEETATTLLVIAATVLTLPLALRESAGESLRTRTLALTRRNLILGLLAVVVLVNVYYAYGQGLMALVMVCGVLPFALAAMRARAARRGQVELGLLRHPLRRESRPHLLQALNIWLVCTLLVGVLAAGGAHVGRTGFSLNLSQFDAMIGFLTGGVVLLAALALVPRRRVYVATNIALAVLSAVLVFQLAQLSTSPTEAVVLDVPVAGEWFVTGAGRSLLLNGHSPNEINAVDFRRLGPNGRTHTGGGDAPLTDYVGFGMPVLAPADGRIVDVFDGDPDMPPGTNGDRSNILVIDIGGGRYVVLGHLKQDSVRVGVGDVVRQGQPLAAVGNTGNTNEPHLHLQVQSTPSGDTDADHTYPMVFRNADITRGGAWPWGDARALRPGDLIRTHLAAELFPTR